MVLHPWIQPTAGYVVSEYLFSGEKINECKLTHTVQTHVVQGSTVQIFTLPNHIVI